MVGVTGHTRAQKKWKTKQENEGYAMGNFQKAAQRKRMQKQTAKPIKCSGKVDA